MRRLERPGPGAENMQVREPFAGYKDFDDCVAKNSDKEDPKAYCASIMQKVEGEAADGRPPKDWFDNCVAAVKKSGSAYDANAVCGNLWHNIMHNVDADVKEFIRRKETLAKAFEDLFKKTQMRRQA